MTSLPVFLGSTWAVLAVLMLCAYAVARRFRDAGVVDVTFAFGFGAAGVAAAIAFDGDATRRWILGGLCAAWGARLGIHLASTRVLRGHEDGRYAILREQWGARAEPKFFAFFQVQALLVAGLALGPALVARRPESFGSAQDLVALALFASSVVGSAVADAQLARFRTQPEHRGRTCRSGLWAYSRHPNYFFEWLHWLAYCAWAWGAPGSWLAWLPAAAMTYFMLAVTGIPPTEAQALRSRGDDYRRYQREVSAFVPWLPRSSRTETRTN